MNAPITMPPGAQLGHVESLRADSLFIIHSRGLHLVEGGITFSSVGGLHVGDAVELDRSQSTQQAVTHSDRPEDETIHTASGAAIALLTAMFVAFALDLAWPSQGLVVAGCFLGAAGCFVAASVSRRVRLGSEK